MSQSTYVPVISGVITSEFSGLCAKIVAPTQWQSTHGFICELRPKPDNGYQLIMHFVNSVDEDVEEDEAPTHVLTLASDGLLHIEVGGREQTGVIADDRIYWSDCVWSKFDRAQTVCQRGDHVIVLDEGNWKDGIIKDFKEVDGEAGLFKSYAVIMFGVDDEDEDCLLEGVPQEIVRKINIGFFDRALLVKDLFQYFSDIGLDGWAMAIFLQKQQYMYFVMNLGGVVLNVLTNAFFNSRELSCSGVLKMVVGFDFLGEFRATWRRGYRTPRFISFKGFESGVEGLVSTGVQIYAVLYSVNYSTLDNIVISVSIASSIFGYATNMCVDLAEALYGRGLVNPEEQRVFKKEFRRELAFVVCFRIVEALSRSCLVGCFCLAFRPFGVAVWVLVQVASVLGIYLRASKQVTPLDSYQEIFPVAAANALMPWSWLSISEPLLAPPDTYSDGILKFLVKEFYGVKVILDICLLISVAALRGDVLEEKILPVHHRFVILCVGLFGILLHWMSLAPLFYLMGKPSLRRELPPQDSHGEAAGTRNRINVDMAQQGTQLLCC